MSRFILIHSPFLGPSVWSALLTVLAREGHDAVAPDLRGEVRAGGETYRRLADRVSGFVDGETAVVAHSGAGAFLPSIFEVAADRIRSMVFMDALLPHPGRSWFETLPNGVADKVRASAVNGFAAPWPDWLPDGTLRQLLPDDDVRQSLIAEAPKVPLTFLSATAPSPGRWSEALGCSYIQLSPAYAGEAEEAGRLNWPVERLAGHHLSMMTRPELISSLLVRLVRWPMR
jgi:pimeloyl-ACP methyl ester carboxylesterase